MNDWDDWIARYKSHLELEGLAARTIKGRTWLLSKFIAWCRELGIESPSGLTTALVEDYRRFRIQYVNARGSKDRAFTVNTHLLALRDFFKMLVAKGAIPALLLEPIRYVKEPKHLPKEALTFPEVLKILEAIPGDTPIHLRDRAILEVLYSTGMRREELLMLAVADVDLEGRVLRIEAGKGEWSPSAGRRQCGSRSTSRLLAGRSWGGKKTRACSSSRRAAGVSTARACGRSSADGPRRPGSRRR